MKSLLPILALGFASAAIADDAESIVRFANGDRLAGSLESLTPDLLVWKSPVLETPGPFFLNRVIDLSLPGTVPESSADHEAILKLTNGDTVRGQLASVTDETVSLDTWFAGRMNFNRLMVTGVKIEGKSKYLFRGPSGMDGWTQSGDAQAWTYSRSAFRSHAAGSIARDGVLPDECSVTFDTAWKGDAVALKVIVFSDDPSSDTPSSGYEISFQRGSIYLRNCKTQSFLGSTHSQELMEEDKVHMEIRASRKTGKVCLLVNNHLIEVWSDPDMAKGKFGSCLHFVAQNTLPMRISGIGVSPWDGLVEQVPEPRIGGLRQLGGINFGLQGQQEEAKPAPKQKPAENRMELANGDSLQGEVTAIHDGLIELKTPLGDVKLPVARLRSVALKKADLERAKLRNGDIRAWFPDGSSMVFRLDSVGDGTLTGYSQNFGTATFRMSAFSRIEFNIYDPQLDDKRAADEW